MIQINSSIQRKLCTGLKEFLDEKKKRVLQNISVSVVMFLYDTHWISDAIQYILVWAISKVIPQAISNKAK